MEKKDRSINYYLALLAPLAVISLGWAVVGFPLAKADLQLGVLAVATIVLSSVVRIQLPRHNIHLTISDALIILSMLIYGAEVAILIAAVETAYTAFDFRRKGVAIRYRTILINVMVSVTVVFVTGQVIELSFGSNEGSHGNHSETMFIVLLSMIAATMFLVNTICVSPFLAIKNEKSIREVWRDYCLDAFVMYLIGAFTAGLMLETLERINYVLFGVVIGIVALIYWTYKRNVDDLRQTAVEAKEAEMLRAEQAEEHVTELEHYVSELESTGRALRVSREEFRHAAYHDDLTGLPNRRQFFDLLQLQIDQSKEDPSYKFALLFLDLNRFKTINESLGYSTGGRLLRHVAKRLTKIVGNTAVVGRFSGDEFAVLLPRISGLGDAVDLAKRVAERISEPFRLGNRRVFTTVSIGIALGNSRYVRSEEILRDSDIAMYRAKESRQPMVIFDQTMHSSAVSLLELETDLRFAITRDQFEVFYQPIVEIDSLRLSGFEALVRWKNPRRGIVSPNDFIPLSEATGLIVPMTLIILRKACAQLAEWRRLSYMNRALTVSVNLSGKHFAEPKLVEQIKDIICETGIDPACLKLEITESAMMEDAENAIIMLRQIREAGVKLCIDDFGTGHSSLSYLHRFPIDTLKVDRSFVSSMDNRAGNGEIVRTIVTLARALNLHVVAEGIETSSQLRQLRRLGCELGQGYIFSGPLPANGIEQLLADPLIWSDILPTKSLAIPTAGNDQAGFIFVQ